VLGVSPAATAAEIKAAYRALVKQHHPDAGGDDRTILALNAAWEVLRDVDRRRRHDQATRTTTRQRVKVTDASTAPSTVTATEQDLLAWLQLIVAPCDRFLGQVINSFPAQLKALAADPYDDALMEQFCRFLEISQARTVLAHGVFDRHAQRPVPPPAGGGPQRPAGTAGFCVSTPASRLVHTCRGATAQTASSQHIRDQAKDMTSQSSQLFVEQRGANVPPE